MSYSNALHDVVETPFVLARYGWDPDRNTSIHCEHLSVYLQLTNTMWQARYYCNTA